MDAPRPVVAQHDIGRTAGELLQPEGLQVPDVVDAAQGAGRQFNRILWPE